MDIEDFATKLNQEILKEKDDIAEKIRSFINHEKVNEVMEGKNNYCNFVNNTSPFEFDVEKLNSSNVTQMSDFMVQVKRRLYENYKSMMDYIQSVKDQLIKNNEIYIENYSVKSEKLKNVMKLLNEVTSAYIESYEEKLDRIDKYISSSRDKLLSSTKKILESLHSSYRQNQMRFLSQQREQVLKQHIESEATMMNEDEELYHMKSNLESEIKILERQMQTLTTNTTLKQEKLDYNFKILSDREEENAKLLNVQKRRLTKIKDSISRTISEYNSLSSQYQNTISNLTEDYKVITHQEKTLKARIKHFNTHDNKYAADLISLQWHEEFLLRKRLELLDKRIQFELGYTDLTDVSTNEAFEHEEHSNSISKTITTSENIQQLKLLLKKALSSTFSEEENVLEMLGFDKDNDPELHVLIQKLQECSEEDKLLATLVEHFTKKSKLQSVFNSEALASSASNSKSITSKNGYSKNYDDWKQLFEATERRYRVFSKASNLENRTAVLERENKKLKEKIKKHLSDPAIRKLLVPPAQALC